jgi:hypothetical protein
MLSLLLAAALMGPPCEKYPCSFPSPDGCNTVTCEYEGGGCTSTLVYCSKTEVVGPAQYQPPDTDRVVLINLADRMADHGWWVGMASAADLGTTGWALHKCPTCYEQNPLGVNVESRIALKLAAMTGTMGAIWKLEKSGHSKEAKIARWIYVGVCAGLAVNNSVHAIRGK